MARWSPLVQYPQKPLVPPRPVEKRPKSWTGVVLLMTEESIGEALAGVVELNMVSEKELHSKMVSDLKLRREVYEMAQSILKRNVYDALRKSGKPISSQSEAEARLKIWEDLYGNRGVR